MRSETIAPSHTHTCLLAEPSLPDIFHGQAKLLYAKKENGSIGQRLKNFILKPLMIVAAKASVLKILKGSAFKNNQDAERLKAHIKSLGFFEGVNQFKVTDFLVDAALHGSRLDSSSDTTNKAEKSLAALTSTALREHLNNAGYMVETLKEYLGSSAEGLNEFHSFQADPSIQLSDTQIAKINALNKKMEAIKSDKEKSKKIPDEVFTKFSEIYQGLSQRLQAKDLELSASNLIDRLLELNPRTSNVDYFLAFFQPNNPYILGGAITAMAVIFKQNLAELANTLDPYNEDASMRATLEILADEFLAHANNTDQPWATAEAIKTLNQNLKKHKEDEEKNWI